MDRQQTFQRLKKPCLELLQILASLPQRPSARKDLVQALTRLLSSLQTITSTPGALDAKLAEYAFVPISQVLRISGTVPVRALELCLECISSLLSTGWGGILAPELSGQLLILFTFMAKPSSAENGIAATSEELQALAFKCIAELFTQVTRSPKGKQSLTATANIPALGEAVLIMLDALTESNSNNVKLQALAALTGLILALDDRDALASFLPRMVSALTKVLTPSSNSRASFRVLQHSLEIMDSLFLLLLSDRETKNLPATDPAGDSGNNSKILRSASWLRATATQVKVALANIFKLRHHDKMEVRQALLQLCLNIVQECRTSLAECTSMAIETCITLAGRGGGNDRVERDLKVLISVDHTLSALLRESLHGWVISLPRLMQSKDDTGRRQIIHQISVTLRLLDEEPATISDVLAENLRDGVSTIFTDSKGLKALVESTTNASMEMSMVLGSTETASFQPLRQRLKSQDDMMQEFGLLLRELAQSQSALTVAQELIQTLDMGSQETRLASYWLSVNLLKTIMATAPAIDDFIDMGTPDLQGELLDDLYSHSLAILSQQEPGDEAHWHFSALALEAVALQATRYKDEFRAEMSETLYPVLHHLGSSNFGLRQHAITCLNIIASSCVYESAGDLVVANVDYIVNAVGLKLNYGDISPQAPQVLLMMMRLCGPSLLPYLDDLIGSIFGALERFHGYPKLVELLFSVLKGMVEEGVKSPPLAITAKEEVQEKTSATKRVSMTEVVETIRKLDADAREHEWDEQIQPDTFPQKPWKEAAEEEPGQENGPEKDEESTRDKEPTEQPPPAPRIFEILLKISELTQHYLTSSSPSLRTSLLSLLQTTIPALSKHENSFLPLINTLWPVLIPRLEDPEAYIVSNALDIIALMCEHAGHFIRSRIEGAWDMFKAIHLRTLRKKDSRIKGKLASTSLNLSQVQTSMKSLTLESRPASEPSVYRPEMYVDAPTRMIWESLVRLLCAVAKNVAIREEYFDELLDMLDPVLERDDVREALNERNADAVWLRLHITSRLSGRASSSINVTGAFLSRMKAPIARSHWKFARI